MPDEWMEEMGLDQILHPDLYEQDIDAAAEEYEANKPRAAQIVIDNNDPWE